MPHGVCDFSTRCRKGPDLEAPSLLWVRDFALASAPPYEKHRQHCRWEIGETTSVAAGQMGRIGSGQNEKAMQKSCNIQNTNAG